MSETLRIGAFFDGTGNNMWNDLVIGDASQTNIAKLYKLYKDQNYRVEYEEGVGTEAYTEQAPFSEEIINGILDGSIIKSDQYDSTALKYGTTAKDHVRSMLAKIEDIIGRNPDKKIVIDVYGFSRGAAEARDFVNEINKIYTNVDGKSVVGFVGLFDTVASIGLATDIDWSLNLNLDEDSAQRIVHLTAQNEKRTTFPLDTLSNSVSDNIEEISLPGVHSDIGGGYGTLDLEKVLVVEGTGEIETFVFDSDMQARIAQRELEVQALEAQHPGVDYELKYETRQGEESQLFELSSLIVENREIKHGLSNVALNKMYSEMTAAGIALPPLSSLGSDELWKEPASPYNVEEYIHVSASDNWYQPTSGESVAFGAWLDERLIYSNDSNEAEVDLLLISSRDKTIIYDRVPGDHTVFGVTEEHLSALSDYTENYLQDRANFLYWKLKYNSEDKAYNETYTTSEVTGNWDYVNYEQIIGGTYGGDPLTLQIDGNGVSTDHQIVFGSENRDSLIGDELEDHLYGGAGNDTLVGRDGADYLEGGEGDDFYDAMDGDTIFDSDGEGHVRFENNLLMGGKLQDDGSYLSADGAITYQLVGNTLTVTAFNRNLTINKFTSGDLGITLEGPTPPLPQQTNDIEGDLLAQDFDSNTPGIQTQKDELGNIITTSTPAPDQADILYDSTNNDHVIAGGGDDEIQALRGGEDHIEAGAGQDLVVAGADNDLIEGGSETDILVGGAGDDHIFANIQSDYDTIFLSNEQTPTGPDRDWLTGGDGDDLLVGSNGHEAFSGGGGNDTILAGAGDDNIFGDSDWVADSFDWTYADSNPGGDNIRTFSPVVGAFNPGPEGIDVIYAGAGNDYVWADGGNDIVFGESGDDHLQGQAGDDIISGGSGADIIRGDGVETDDIESGNDHLYGDEGDDKLYGGAGSDNLYGGSGADELKGDGGADDQQYHGNDTLDGGEGNDTLTGSGGHDTLYGGEGNDYLYGDADDIKESYQGNDWLYGDAGNDHLSGYGGNDHLYGGVDNDRLYGGEGNDRLEGESGTDYLYGDNGNDEILGGADTDYLYGGEGNDTLSGGSGEDILNGGKGDDIIRGNTGIDHLYGEEGADTFTFALGDGVDVIYDSDGADRIKFEGVDKNSITSSLISNTDGSPYLQLQYSNDDVVFVKNGLTGGIKSFEFVGDATWTPAELLASTLTESVDYRMDKAGSVYGGSFDDVLVGSTGSDEIYGQNGNDVIAGNTGDDLLVGGLGQDTYRIDTGTGRDTITEADESGTIQLQPGANIADLAYEQQGDNLYIHFKDSRDGVVITDFYLGAHTWQIEDENGGSLVIQKDNVPGDATPVLATTIEDAWTDFEKQIQSYYEGLMRVSSYQKQGDGTYTKTTNNGYVHANYTMDILTTNITTNDSSYMRELPQTDQQQTGYRSEIVVTNISTRPDGIRLTVGAGASNQNFVNLNNIAASGYSGIQLQNNAIPIVSENSLMDPFSGYSQNSLTGYWYYANGVPAPQTSQQTITHHYYDYDVSINVVSIDADSQDNTIMSGKGTFSLVDGSAGNDVLDARPRYHDYYNLTGQLIYEKFTYTGRTGASVDVPGNIQSIGITQAPGSLLFGNQGDDTLLGGSANDLLIGGAGSDYLVGGMGNDTYLMLGTDGSDTIFEDGWSVSGIAQEDILVLPTGVNINDLTFTWGETIHESLYPFEGDWTNYDWWGRVKSIHTTPNISWSANDNVTLILPHTDQRAGMGIDFVQFDNGDRISLDQIALISGNSPTQDAHATANTIEDEGILYGGDGNDLLLTKNALYESGGYKQSTLIGGYGNDRLVGGLGEDILFGGIIDNDQPEGAGELGNLWDGGNTYHGGGGSDEIWATAGADTFEFNAGDGQDTVTDLYHLGYYVNAIEQGYRLGTTELAYQLRWVNVEDYAALEPGHLNLVLNSHDILRFESSISPNDIQVLRSSADPDNQLYNDLVFAHTNGNDRIAFVNWFKSDINQLNRVEFSDGTVWNGQDIENLLNGLPINQNPIVYTPLPDQAATEDELFSYQVPANTFTDPDSADALSLSASLADDTSLPGWLNFDATTGTFSGTPDNASVGPLDIRVTATDSGGKSNSDTFTLIIANVNDAPTLNAVIADQAVAEDAVFSYTLPAGVFSDMDAGDTLTLTATLADGAPLPSWLSFDTMTGTFSGTPDNDQVGDIDVQVTATDTAGEAVSDIFTISVTNTNDAPAISSPIADQSATEDNAFSYTLAGNTFVDVDAGDTLSLTATCADGSPLPAWLTFDPATGIFSGTPTSTDTGILSIEVIATDSDGLTISDVFDVVIDSSTPSGNIIQGTANNDNLTGTAGNDTFIGGTGNDTMSGGDGDDTFIVEGTDQGGDRVYGGEGFDTIQGSEGDDTFGLITLHAIDSVDRIDGGLGHNTINGNYSGNILDFSATELINIAAIDGGAGHDQITGSSGNDTIIGGTGNDTMNGGDGDDTFIVEGVDQGGDRVYGGEGFDIIQGREGDDTFGLITLHAVDSVDRIDGGLGQNTIVGNYSGNILNFSATELINIAAIDGGAGHDQITGSSGNDTIIGGTGNDTLKGDTGDDTFIVNGTDQGQDRIYGADGFDTIQGSEGDDRFNLLQLFATDSIERIDGGLGYNTVYGGWGNNTLDLTLTELINIAAIDGGANNDIITGSAGNDTIIGGTGNDTLNGGAGSDTYRFSTLDGKDTINNHDTSLNSTDLLDFVDIAHDQFWFTQNNNDLVIDVIGTNDKVTVKDWYIDTDHQLDAINASDSTLQQNQVDQLVNAMTVFNVPTGVGAVVPQEVKDQLSPVLASAWQ